MLLRISLLFLFFMNSGCKKQAEILSEITSTQENKLTKALGSICAQQVLNLWIPDKKGQMFLFGKNDSSIRSQFTSHTKVYIDTGRDFDPTPIVVEGIPKFHAACMEFYRPVIEKCASLLSDQPMYQKCVGPADKEYQTLFEAFVSEKSSAGGKVDLDEFDISKLQRIARANLIDPKGELNSK